MYKAGGDAVGADVPSYLPQPGDEFGGSKEGTSGMGPIGPWATGKVDWSPMAGLTGTRPVVDHYSVTRYSEAEWRKHNEEVLCSSADDLHRVNMQTTPLGWENCMKEALTVAEAVRGQSCELRTLLDGPILQDCIRDLKAQADKVDMALARSISDTQQCVTAMVHELEVVVRRNAECEKIIMDLQNGIRGLDKAMKTAQTRLDFLQKRPRGENTRDKSQFGLVDEVKNLSEMISTLKGQLTEAEESLHNLIKSRTILEKELQNKLKTIEIDRNRCQVVRAHYPSAAAMSGF